MRCENDENLLSLAMESGNDDSALWETLLGHCENAWQGKFEALQQMCTSGNVRAELVRLLIDHIARCRERMPREEYRRRRTELLPLHEVVRTGTLTMARDMLRVDAKLCEDMAAIRENDSALYTPMQAACIAKRWEMVAELVKHLTPRRVVEEWEILISQRTTEGTSPSSPSTLLEFHAITRDAWLRGKNGA
ncbi:hypothetical protein CYMTET_3258 [Cymbomonas tetramitiformis]|uniref:Uncharacterized protein n=1 Tax=Cymbomonas tetramitiformis TaxID=36881 RepID=A0AAE0H5F4_9CHLO|nr:hypothetical protein CYMTET_3258 [Cymbomonas tetramitiformis]